MQAESNNDRCVVVPSHARARELWTEITKDLVKKEAIETMGYQYEETDEFFYVMDYLRYVRGVMSTRAQTADTSD